MSKFITFGEGANRMTLNIEDIVSVKRESNHLVEINYRNADYNSNAPFIIEAISIGMSESKYKELLAKMEED